MCCLVPAPQLTNVRCYPLDISDHYGVMACLPIFHNNAREKERAHTSRAFYRIDWLVFAADLREDLQGCCASWNAQTSVDKMTDDWYGSIFRVLDRHAPVQTRHGKERRSCPWLTDELVSLVRERNSLHGKWMKDKGNSPLRARHRDARTAARRLDRHLRNRYFVEKCKTSDHRKLWQVPKHCYRALEDQTGPEGKHFRSK